jgi:very-short-patch-repair endonuclease
LVVGDELARVLDAMPVVRRMKRQNELWIRGDRVLRFPAWAVCEQPRQVVTQVRAALSAAGWRGPV